MGRRGEVVFLSFRAYIFDNPSGASASAVMIESNVAKILYVYNHFKTRPGEALISNHFLGVGRFRRWDANDLQSGIEEAHRIGLVERAEHGWRLTEAGYREASKLQMAETH